MDALTPAANNVLWNQFGEILRRIHNVRGDKFGLPISGFQFSSWSQTVIDRLERTLLAAQKKQFEIPHLASILERIRIHPHLLDEIQIPRLLHGDLWSFNILITQDANGPAIAGVLDADRAWWGDPMADWTLFILKHAEKEEGHSHFWKTYGRFKNTTASKCRSYVYDAMHAGTAFVWATQHQDDETVMRAQGTLSEAAAALQLCL
jgi:aminoglycoside phosphotransferase (APT) family kinase protein